MESRDFLAIGGALVVVLILALVVKPMLTGEAPDLGLPAVTPEPIDMGLPAATGQPGLYLTQAPEDTSFENAPHQASTPEEKPAVILPQTTPVSWQPDPENPMPAIQMVEYADIVGRYTGNTAAFRVPTPYWEISYFVTPNEANPVFQMDVVEKGSDRGEDKTIRSMVYRPGKIPDPKEGRFFSGGRDYYLRITADQLEKYQVKILIPLKYIPDA